MSFELSKRLQAMPPYVFAELNRFKAEAQKKGISLMSLAIGDPDQPTPPAIVEKMREALGKTQNHFYSPYEGSLAFRQAVSRWMQERFGVTVEPEKEVTALIGSKEGIAHFPLAFCNPGDNAIYPSPGYPIFQTSLLMAGANAIPLPLRAEDGFLPDPARVEELFVLHQPKYMLINFPANPTSAVCSRELLTDLVTLAKKHRVILAYDNAYSEIYYDRKNRPLSILEIPGAKDIAVEFHSLSKTFNMTGWRLGYAVGNPELVQALVTVKTNVDSGPLLSVQETGAYALAHADELCDPIRALYSSRRAKLLSGLDSLGVEYLNPKATFFVWARVPFREKSMDFCKNLINQQGLVVTPGIGFGQEGEYYFRLAMTVPESQMDEAMGRLENYLRKK